jgi:hypothetical protein
MAAGGSSVSRQRDKALAAGLPGDAGQASREGLTDLEENFHVPHGGSGRGGKP